MSEIKVISKLFNQKDVLQLDEQSFNKAVGKVIQADKEIISKIEVEYNEENDLTYFYFPVGVMPLSLQINTHTLFFKNYMAVNDSGVAVEGYEIDEIYCDSNESYICFTGDLSEQIINGLIYVLYDKTPSANLAINSYYLFFPQEVKPLYFHPITISNTTEAYTCKLTIFIINNQATAFTKSSLKQYLINTSARILLNGAYYSIGSFYLSPALIDKGANDVLYISGIDNLGTNHSVSSNEINFSAILDASSTYFNDGVNKIN